MAYLATDAGYEMLTIDWLLDIVRSRNIQPGPGGSTIVEFPEVEPVREFLGVCWAACKLVGLWPSQQIVAHADQPIPGTRYHLPLQSNSGCWSFHGGDWQQLDVGRIYTMDPAIVHGAVNWGSETRFHLLIDTEGPR